MNAWRALMNHAPALAEKVRLLRPPKLRVVADGRVLYWALVVPREEDREAHGRFPGQSASSLEGWLVERLAFWGGTWPGVREIEIWGVWAGNPPRLEPVARVRAKAREAQRA